MTSAPPTRYVLLVLPFATESLNVRDRKHWSARRRSQDLMRGEVIAALGGTRDIPRPPFGRARITVVRSSSGQLDEDNLVSSCKALLDVLCVQSATHPLGLGLIEDDSPRHIELIVRQGSAPRGRGVTTVQIDELPGIVAPASRRKRQVEAQTTLPAVA